MNDRLSLKIFCTGKEQDKLIKSWNLEKDKYIDYPGFLVVHVTKQVADEITESYVIEDITAQYTVTFEKKDLNDVSTEAGKDPGTNVDIIDDDDQHHFLVQFIGPIKESWKNALRRKGLVFRKPYQTFTYVVLCTKSQIMEVDSKKFPYAKWVGYLPADHRNKILIDRLPTPDESGMIEETLIVEFFSEEDMIAGKEKINSDPELGKKVRGKKESPAVKVITERGADAVLVIRVTGSVETFLATAILLSQIHGVWMVRPRVRKKTKNNVASGILGVDEVREYLSKNYDNESRTAEGYQLTGKNEIVAVCDTGFDIGRKKEVHPDFAGRVKAVKSYPISDEDMPEVFNKRRDSGAADLGGHGTHVAGSVLGDGTGSEKIKGHDKPVRGIAYEAELVFQAVEQEMYWRNPEEYKTYGRFYLSGLEDITDILRYAYGRGARIHSNSWGGGWEGVYDNTSRLVDKFMWDHKDFVVVVCAGNEGTDKNFQGEIQPTSIASPATAKNCITVGASESLRTEFSDQTYGKRWPADYPVAPFWGSPMANNPYQIVAFSSRGPTNDGRIKPDIVAPGTFILSTRSRAMSHEIKSAWGSINEDPENLDYIYMGGTSMATPLVSGVCALLRQYFKEFLYIKKPSAALLKASLIGSALKLPNYSPAEQHADNHQGYGRVNLKNIICPNEPAEVCVFDELNDRKNPKNNLRTGDLAEFKFVIESNRAPLRIAMAYTDFPGERLVNNLNLLLFRSRRSRKREYHIGYGETENKRKPDAVNNTEVIDIKNPEPGTWVLQVIASNVPHGPQDYALFFSGHFKKLPVRLQK